MQYHMKKKDKILMNKFGPKLLISQYYLYEMK